MEVITREVVLLYVSDAMLLLFFLAGIVWFVGWLVERTRSRLVFYATAGDLRRFVWAQLVVVLFALLGFKFVVLSGGPGVAVSRILSAGVFTRYFSAVAVGLCFVVCVMGLVRWVAVFRRWFLRRW